MGGRGYGVAETREGAGLYKRAGLRAVPGDESGRSYRGRSYSVTKPREGAGLKKWVRLRIGLGYGSGRG